jgi:hypothetical protein
MRSHSWVILAGLVLFLVPGAARAQEETGAPPPSGTAPGPDGPGARGNGRRVEGVIVSVRGDVIQIRPRYGTQLTRILVDEEASLSRQEQVRPDQLRAGEWVSGMGEVDAQGAVRPRFLQVAEERGGFFAGRGRSSRGGVRPSEAGAGGGRVTGAAASANDPAAPGNGTAARGDDRTPPGSDTAAPGTDPRARGTNPRRGRNGRINGQIKSVQPFVVSNNGVDVTLAFDGPVSIQRSARMQREALRVGEMISATGERTTDGLLHVRRAQVQPAPEGDGTLFGQVVAIHEQTIDVRPRFSDDTIPAMLAENTILERQVTVDPDGVKVGDVITAQGRLTGGTAEAPAAMTAAVLLLGRQSYPKTASAGEFRPTRRRGGGGPEVVVTGKVASLSPFTLAQEAGPSVTVTIPGQVPVVDLQTISLGELKPGEKIMLIGGDGPDGGMRTKTVVLAASPILGFRR